MAFFQKVLCSNLNCSKNDSGSGGIRTHAPEETGALNQRLRPLGHATFLLCSYNAAIFPSDLNGFLSKKYFVLKMILAAVGFEPTPPKRLVP